MYTETELREALQLSAARADTLIEATDIGGAESARGELVALAASSERLTARRRWLPPAAAALVAVAVGASLFVVFGANDTGTKHAPATSPAPAASAATDPSMNSPTVAPPPTRVALNNLITVAETGSTGYSFGPAGGPQVQTVGGTTAVTVIALPASIPFDPTTQITDAQRVQVAGTNGYYGVVAASLGDPTGDASKYGPPKTTLAWRAPNATWILIQGENAGVNLSLTVLVSRYQQLGITATPVPLPPVPYHAGWLPDNLALTSLDWKPGVAGSYLSDVTLTSGTNRVEINLFQGSTAGAGPIVPIPGSSPANVDPYVTRDSGDTNLTVSVHGYPQSTAQKILDNLDLSKLTNAESTWWSPADAFNS